MIKPGIDIVVVNYRTPDDLIAFCLSLSDNLPTIEYDVRICNVDPELGDLQVGEYWVKKIPNAYHWAIYDNVGYARAVNASVAHGLHDVIAIFNADVRVTPGSLDECYKAIQAFPDWGVLGPRQVDANGHITHGGIIGPREAPKFRGWRQRSTDTYRDVLENVPTVMGSAYFVKRECWAELSNCETYKKFLHDNQLSMFGAFLPTHLYYEETWCSYHAIEHGWKVVYYGPVEMVHEWHGSISKHLTIEQEHSIMDRSKQLFRACCDAHGGIPHD